MYSKSEYTLESVSMSCRLHDYFWKAHPIVMKFCTHNCLINISVEFEDENDSPKICRVIAKNVIIFYAFLYKHWPIPIFANNFSVIIKITTITVIYHSIENFTGYKMVYKTLRKNQPTRFFEVQNSANQIFRGLEFSQSNDFSIGLLSNQVLWHCESS